MAQLVKNLPAMWETWVGSLGWEDPPEKGTPTHSGILAWRIPWTIVHGVAKSRTWLSDVHFHFYIYIYIYIYICFSGTFLLFQWSKRCSHEFEQVLGVGGGQGSLACGSPWGRKESDMTEWLNCTELIYISVSPGTEYIFDSWSVIEPAAPALETLSLIILLICFCLCCEGYFPVVCPVFSLQWFLSLQSMGSRVWGLQQLWRLGSGAQAR